MIITKKNSNNIILFVTKETIVLNFVNKMKISVSSWNHTHQKMKLGEGALEERYTEANKSSYEDFNNLY